MLLGLMRKANSRLPGLSKAVRAIDLVRPAKILVEAAALITALGEPYHGMSLQYVYQDCINLYLAKYKSYRFMTRPKHLVRLGHYDL